jgi:hypothetical protein
MPLELVPLEVSEQDRGQTIWWWERGIPPATSQTRDVAGKMTWEGPVRKLVTVTDSKPDADKKRKWRYHDERAPLAPDTMGFRSLAPKDLLKLLRTKLFRLNIFAPKFNLLIEHVTLDKNIIKFDT